MSRSGNLAEWERRLAAQHREDERLTRERTRREKQQEKVRQQERHDAEQRSADEQAAAVQEQIKSLDEVLTSVLPLPPMSFDRLMAAPRTPPFDPGSLGEARPDPDWGDFAPAPPRGLGRLIEQRRDATTARVELVGGEGAVDEFPTSSISNFFTRVDLKRAEQRGPAGAGGQRFVDFEIKMNSNYAI